MQSLSYNPFWLVKCPHPGSNNGFECWIQERKGLGKETNADLKNGDSRCLQAGKTANMTVLWALKPALSTKSHTSTFQAHPYHSPIINKLIPPLTNAQIPILSSTCSSLSSHPRAHSSPLINALSPLLSNALICAPS